MLIRIINNISLNILIHQRIVIFRDACNDSWTIVMIFGWRFRKYLVLRFCKIFVNRWKYRIILCKSYYFMSLKLLPHFLLSLKSSLRFWLIVSQSFTIFEILKFLFHVSHPLLNIEVCYKYFQSFFVLIFRFIVLQLGRWIFQIWLIENVNRAISLNGVFVCEKLILVRVGFKLWDILVRIIIKIIFIKLLNYTFSYLFHWLIFFLHETFKYLNEFPPVFINIFFFLHSLQFFFYVVASFWVLFLTSFWVTFFHFILLIIIFI